MRRTTTWLASVLLALGLFAGEGVRGQAPRPDDCAALCTIDLTDPSNLSADSVVAVTRCYLRAINSGDVCASTEGIVRLLAPLNFHRRLDLLDSLQRAVAARPDLGDEQHYYLTRSRGDLYRKRLDYASADSCYQAAFPYAQTEYQRVGTLLFAAYAMSNLDRDDDAAAMYQRAFGYLTDPAALDPDEYYSVFNLSAAINTHIGSQNEAMLNYESLFYSTQLSASRRARAASNMLDVYAGQGECDSVRKLAAFVVTELTLPADLVNTHWQLLNCAGLEGDERAVDSLYALIEWDDTDARLSYLRPYVEMDYAAAKGDQRLLRAAMDAYLADTTNLAANVQYMRSRLVKNYFKKADPYIHHQLTRYTTVQDSLRGTEAAEALAKTEVAQDLKLKESEAKVLETELLAQRRVNRLQLMLAILFGLTAAAAVWGYSRLKRANARVRFLHAELAHRTTNQMLLAQVLARDLRHSVQHPEAREALADLDGKLTALSLVDRSLKQAGDGPARLDELLHDLVGRIEQSSPVPFTVDAQLDPVAVPANVALTNALILNELLTNSIKYAFTPRAAVAGGPRGTAVENVPNRLHLCVQQVGERIAITYRDNGPGKDGQVRGTGQGSDLLKEFFEDLDAEVAEGNGSGYEVTWTWEG